MVFFDILWGHCHAPQEIWDAVEKGKWLTFTRSLEKQRLACSNVVPVGLHRAPLV
jgi:hypothetical protein